MHKRLVVTIVVSVLENDFWTPPLSLSINSEHDLDFNFFQHKIFILYYFSVRLRKFLGRALRLGQARGPSALAPAARTDLQKSFSGNYPIVNGTFFHCFSLT